MTSNIEQAQKVLERLDKMQGSPKTGWLPEFRRQQIEKFSKLGIPTVKDEEWKYTNIAPMLERSLATASTASPLAKNDLLDYCNAEDINIVFINGAFSATHSNIDDLPQGVIIRRLFDSVAEKAVDLKKILSKESLNDLPSFLALNNAFALDGTLIKVSKDAAINRLIHIIHFCDGASTMVFPRTVIVMDPSTRADILESFISFTDAVYCTNSITDIYLDRNARLRYAQAQSESVNAVHIGSTRVWQERDSDLDTFTLTVSGQLVRNNLTISLEGEGANARLNGLYAQMDTHHVDNHTLVDHREPNCTSNQLYKGILTDSSRAVFNGKIYVQQIAQKTNAYQLNKNLLLGKDCRVDTKPQLEIHADDVKCTHGAAIGQLNEDELFYLQTRCISRTDAVKMLARGFVEDVLNTFDVPAVRVKMDQLLTKTKILD